MRNVSLPVSAGMVSPISGKIRKHVRVVAFAAIMTLAGASAALSWYIISQPTGVSYATVVLIPPGSQVVEILLPFRLDDSHAQIVDANKNPERWYAKVFDLYPVSQRTQTAVAIFTDQNGTKWLRLETNGTLVVGISWEPRSRADAFPFDNPTARPGGLPVGMWGNSSVRLLVESHSSWYWFWTNRMEVDYAISSTTVGPAGEFPEGTHPVTVLINAAVPVIVDNGGQIPLVWGTFFSRGTP